MKALILEAFKTAYQLKELDKPAAGKGQVLVKVAANSVNPIDQKVKAGLAPHAKPILPAILGVDMSGTIEAVGEGVTGFKPGDEVFGLTGGIAGIPGSLAEYQVADVDLIALKPTNLSLKDAAALPLIFITAWEGIVDRTKVGPGKTVLIHGGAGGVGHIAVQIARAFGAEVYATVDQVNYDLIKNYGATPINYKTTSVEEYIETYTNGEGFDIVLDTVGGEVLDASFKAVKQYTGHVASILGWGNHSLAPLSIRGASYSGVFALYPLISGRGRKKHGQILKEAVKLVESKQVIPLIYNEHYTLETAENAYADVTAGKIKGKVIINVY